MSSIRPSLLDKHTNYTPRVGNEGFCYKVKVFCCTFNFCYCSSKNTNHILVKALNIPKNVLVLLFISNLDNLPVVQVFYQAKAAFIGSSFSNVFYLSYVTVKSIYFVFWLLESICHYFMIITCRKYSAHYTILPL